MQIQCKYDFTRGSQLGRGKKARLELRNRALLFLQAYLRQKKHSYQTRPGFAIHQGRVSLLTNNSVFLPLFWLPKGYPNYSIQKSILPRGLFLGGTFRVDLLAFNAVKVIEIKTIQVTYLEELLHCYCISPLQFLFIKCPGTLTCDICWDGSRNCCYHPDFLDWSTL